MKILVLTSRYTATRDIIDEDFGRQTRLFEALAKYKHDITFYCADYRKQERRDILLHGLDVRIRPFGIWRIIDFSRELDSTLRNEKWDCIIATSDPLWGVMARHYAKKHNIRFIYDLHDNYETYDMYKIPFFKYFDRQAVKHADAVTTVSFELRKMLQQKGIRSSGVHVIQNGADISVFKPMDKLKCRRALTLPANKKIITYTGSIQRSQGVDILLDAFRQVKESEKDAMLIIAGRYFKSEKKYFSFTEEGVKYIGSISQRETAKLINAADVAVVPNKDNEFTRYCFPYKIAEYAACKRPIVVTAVGDAAMIVEGRDDSLCRPSDARDMAMKILNQLKKNGKKIEYDISRNTWHFIARKLNKLLRGKIRT